MQKPQFVEDEIYHIYNRGVEKRKIFMEDKDYFRFIHDLFEFNDKNSAISVFRCFNSIMSEVQLPTLVHQERKPRKLLVEILVFCLMPNHFHLLVRQKGKNGIVKFMQKLGTGYTNYFNLKYKRVGSLFQGRFKAVHVSKEAHLACLAFYIHTNSLELIRKNVGSSTSDILENYRWSSYLDYIGKKNFPSITSREFLLDFLGGEKEIKKQTKEWIKEKEKNLEQIKDIMLDN